ncbi:MULTISPECIES: Asp-tRNA(Asn)/Glu-tRNA(Gln) amidotransferase subunit GatC [Geomicrobium]|uniref:Aspartyl/glutamyl-tRNA(Asn/Gln) amidotransferase subunit C n=1 Tax=Geomicrobium sediminis TaxID=1347788 RepID=A0ABS2PBI7_9BACL|nr:Asp-tRNA(Asn)/Glu-tRNA(Gln) amidotransferase subunit GatC [Geomicrobium sp. JCM 19055]MBM7632218.1 aspartyl-tRNA(Asn)/glutamyl-tRNA(Gln) amidotransferase subunit C [Geomicrobium sediminis]GAJ98387.1 aspartyl-tRNA(Asn) amidotransferase subunit C [Geomicrobium sp. JCM 19055]
MSKITKEQVEHVADLARLSFTEAEIEDFTNQMSKVIDYAEVLNELDTENVEPTTHVMDVRNVLREDNVKPSLQREEALKNAPKQKDGQFEVPSVLD